MAQEPDPSPNHDEMDRSSFDQLMERARDGDSKAIGRLVDQCRNYLLLIANNDLAKEVRGKVGPSDIVQESMLAAQIEFQNFQGSSPDELRAWLKGILRNGLNGAARHFKGIQKRQVSREQSLAPKSGEGPAIEDQFHTPGTHAAKKEEAELLQQTMKFLSEDYQQVLQLRNWEQLSFEEIGIRMERSPDAVRKLWYRAVLELRSLYQDAVEPPSGPDT